MVAALDIDTLWLPITVICLSNTHIFSCSTRRAGMILTDQPAVCMSFAASMLKLDTRCVCFGCPRIARQVLPASARRFPWWQMSLSRFVVPWYWLPQCDESRYTEKKMLSCAFRRACWMKPAHRGPVNSHSSTPWSCVALKIGLISIRVMGWLAGPALRPPGSCTRSDKSGSRWCRLRLPPCSRPFSGLMLGCSMRLRLP